MKIYIVMQEYYSESRNQYYKSIVKGFYNCSNSELYIKELVKNPLYDDVEYWTEIIDIDDKPCL